MPLPSIFMAVAVVVFLLGAVFGDGADRRLGFIMAGLMVMALGFVAQWWR